MNTQEFLNLADLLPEGMLMLSSNGIVLAVNKVAAKKLKISVNHLIGRNLAEFVGIEPDVLFSKIRPCTRSRIPIRLSLKQSSNSSMQLMSQCEGFLLTPAQDGVEAKIVIRLSANSLPVNKFLALNTEIEKQHRLLRQLEQKSIAVQQSEEILNNYTNALAT